MTIAYSRIIDISPPIDENSAVWPGDARVSRNMLCKLEHGDSVALSTLSTTVHIGAHADAPNHFQIGGPSIGEVELKPYLGPCRVFDVRGCGELVEPEMLGDSLAGAPPRILLRTDTCLDRTKWPEHFSAISPRLIEVLSRAGVCLVGIDTPSVDPFTSKTLEAHHACLKAGIRNLEGIILKDVSAGDYDLVALPLRLNGFDASPVRAVLLR